MARPRLEVADVFREHGEEYRQRYGNSMSAEQRRVMRAIELCRTAALGGHVDQCDHCGCQVISYNSCRNRHCPKCQNLDKALWREARLAEVLPLPYFHAIFTFPHQLAPLALQNKEAVYNALFRTASQTLLRIAADPKHLGARLGFTAVLHTWGQALTHHPHLHCVIPGGGLSLDGQAWVGCRKNFFLPVRVLSRLFRRLFVEELQRLSDEGKLGFHGDIAALADPAEFARLMERCRHMEWDVYVQPPFAGAETVLDYLARYTHRIAISNHRLLGMHDGKVTFGYKDYKTGTSKTMTLDACEFIRRFLLHVLPGGFQRIRYYGFLANRHRAQNLKRCRQLLNVRSPSGRTPFQGLAGLALIQALTGIDLSRCPRCNKGHLNRCGNLPPSPPLHRPPPKGRSP